MPAHHPLHAARCRRPAARRLRRSNQRHHDHSGPSEAARARVVARLIAAAQALAADPDAAALLLDGALSQLLALAAPAASRPAASGRAALDALSPAVAARVRLALQAHNPAARLAHCWALLDLLATTTTPTASGLAHAPYVAQPAHQAQFPAQRKDR